MDLPLHSTRALPLALLRVNRAVTTVRRQIHQWDGGQIQVDVRTCVSPPDQR